MIKNHREVVEVEVMEKKERKGVVEVVGVAVKEEVDEVVVQIEGVIVIVIEIGIEGATGIGIEEVIGTGIGIEIGKGREVDLISSFKDILKEEEVALHPMEDDQDLAEVVLPTLITICHTILTDDFHLQVKEVGLAIQ